jgi:transposase
LSPWPTLRHIKRAKRSTLETFLHQHHVRRAYLVEERIHGIRDATALTEDEAVILLVAFGEDRDRCANAAQIQRYSGVAPVVERSGNKCWGHWRFACPTFLRQTFVEWAGSTIPRSYWAGAYYQQQRNKGCSHRVAVRALAFKWIRIIYRCWKTRTPYDESVYLKALMRRGSPLLANYAESANITWDGVLA